MHARAILVAFVFALTTISCAAAQPEIPGGFGSVSDPLVFEEFDPGLGTTLFYPSGALQGPPLVVLVPGGGWVDADPAGLFPLAESLADRGAVVATITYRAAAASEYYPVPVDDLACSVAYAGSEARSAGHQFSEVVVFGHSAGAHLASLYALLPGEFGTACDYEMLAADRLIGLAGPYDVERARRVAVDLFGPADNEADWIEGNPVNHASERPEMPVLLIHGLADATVPLAFTEQFAEALTGGGHDVKKVTPEDADHHSIYSAEVAGPIIAQWLGLDIRTD